MSRALSLAKAAWILAAVAALAFRVYTVFFATATDSHIVLFWAMVVLTFPLGLLPAYAYAFVLHVSGGAGNDVVVWLLMASVGFFQWFWLIPRVFRWSKLRILPSRHP